MNAYGQFCPVAKASAVLCPRWTPPVVRELLCGSRRFSEIQRGVPLMSPTLLSPRLKELSRAGVVSRDGDDRIEMRGPRALVRGLPRWLGQHPVLAPGADARPRPGTGRISPVGAPPRRFATAS